MKNDIIEYLSKMIDVEDKHQDFGFSEDEFVIIMK